MSTVVPIIINLVKFRLFMSPYLFEGNDFIELMVTVGFKNKNKKFVPCQLYFVVYYR